MKIRILLNKMKSAAKSGVALVVVTAIGLTAAGAVTGTDAYVQTDLLAIWDGIENAGSSRQHDSAITEWKDVIGDRAFALTGVTIERDGLVFSGSGASSRGVLSADDATATFVAAGSGTMEIVLEPDEESEVNQRLALQGPTSNKAGLSIGYGKDGRIYFQNLKGSPGISYDWRGEANTFSVRYSQSAAVTDGSGVFRNGELVPEDLYPGPTDFWGTSDSKAYVGGRASGADGFVGKICCVRLYSRQLTAEEIAANAEVDRIRYREHGRIEIVGDPENYGSPTPDYGKFVSTDGEVIDFNVGETVVEGVNYRALCVGHRVLHSNDDGGWVQEGEDSSETAFSYAYDGIGSRRVEWIWQIRHPPCVAEPEIVSARRLSAEFTVHVGGVGYDDYGARLSLVWGTDAQQLDQTNAVATVFAIGDYRAHLTRAKSVDYYVQSVLEKLDADGNVVSAVVSDVVLLPADKLDDEAYGSKGYVTDGLVAWWDGIYNGGLSKTFEATPTEWRDVVGNVAFSVVGYAPSETRDSMAFSGSAGVYGVLSAQDTADTFDRCSNGTLEIVARGNKSDRACIALRGSDTSGIAFGPAGDTATTLSFITSTKVKPTIRGDWNERRTFAVRYEGASPKDAFVDGAPVSWVTDKQDNWGNGGDANRAFVGNRNGASSQYSMDGEICAIRLYSRQLTDDEVAANSRVDDVRFRWQLVNLNSLEITGNPGEYGLVTPAYGRQSDLKAGESIVCRAPAQVLEGDMSATCVGWQLQTNAVGSASTWLPWRSGDGTECDYVHEAGASARLVWQWEVSGGEALDLGAIGFDGVQANAMNARVPVLGLGGADSATLKLEWGCTPTALANEVSRTVTRTGEEVFEIKDLLPGRRCFVRVTLSTDGGAEFVSDIATCDTLAGDEPAGARELILGAGCAYVSSVVADGQPGDGVTVTGKVEFPPAAGDCAWHLLVWKKGASGAMRIAANDVTVDAEGNFDLTVVTDDPEAADYIQPGQSYELSVETDLGDGTVTTSPICGFATASAAAFKNNLFEVSYDCRVLTVKGGALSAGAGDAARITLMVGAGEDSLEDVDEGEVRKSDLNFELSYKVPAIEQTYWWALRLENETAGKTVCWTNVLPAASVVVRDNAHYIWTGAAGNGLWSDCGNWQAQHSPTDPTPVPATDCRGCPNGEQASLSFTDGTDAKIEIDCDVTVYALGLKNQAGAKVILSSASGRTVTHMSDIEISGGNMNDKQMSVVFDGVKVVTEGAVNVKNGCEVIFRNGAGIVCSDYRMRFDDGTFNGGTGTNLTVVSAGCEIKTTQLIVLASGAECVVSNGTLTVGNNLVFNCETDGGILRLEGDSPKVTVGSECRSTNNSRQQTASGGIVFDIPVGGYLTAPITLGGSFGGTDGQACQPLHINLLKASGAYGTGRTLVCPLLSTKRSINVSRQVLGELKRPEKSAFVYSEAVDEPEWKTKDELLPEATPKLFGVRIGAARGLMILFQ